MTKTHYSCAELAALNLPGLPGSEKGWSKLVKRELWPFVDVECAGGKGGLRREYAPPERIAKLIAAQPAKPTTRPAPTGRDVTLTLTVTVREAADLLRWLEKRRARRG